MYELAGYHRGIRFPYARWNVFDGDAGMRIFPAQETTRLMDTSNPFEIPGSVTLQTGKGGLPFIRVESASSTAEIYLLGAHVTHFQRTNEEPLLFMSEASEFEVGKPIRGGVPIVFPWFGGRDGLPAHGFARLAVWDLRSSRVLADGSVMLHFRLPQDDEFETDFTVTVGDTLAMELTVSNTGSSDFRFESCLHTYFRIGDIHQTSVAGLKGTRYLDTLVSQEFTETEDTIRFTGETDRIYQNTTAAVEIHDPVLRRIIHVRKSGSLSTVVWNPWIAKSQRMPDFGDNEYPQMVCVESGNVKENAVVLQPGEVSILRVEIASQALS
jgi:glucose-6-phosphate 1-epimerase